MDNEFLEDKNGDEEEKKHFLEGKEGKKEDKGNFFEGKEGGRKDMLRARGRRQEGKNNWVEICKE